MVEESVRIQEPILNLRRVAIERLQSKVLRRPPRISHKLLGDLWLNSAKVARRAGVSYTKKCVQ